MYFVAKLTKRPVKSYKKDKDGKTQVNKDTSLDEDTIVFTTDNKIFNTEKEAIVEAEKAVRENRFNEYGIFVLVKKVKVQGAPIEVIDMIES